MTGTAAEPDVTISICEVRGHEGHAARITVADRTSTAVFCLPPKHAGFIGGALARFAPGQQQAERELAALRELLNEIGVMAANAPEDGDSFGVLEQIAMRIAAVDVPDSTPLGEWPDPENPVTGRTPETAATEGNDNA
jgi:hypothetical protein